MRSISWSPGFETGFKTSRNFLSIQVRDKRTVASAKTKAIEAIAKEII
jgi:hypothetical protein